MRHLNFDIELLGNCDAIINEICCRLGETWSSLCVQEGPLQQVTKDEMITPPLSSRQSPMSTTIPVSEENSRMSFQLASEDSHMSSQEEEHNSMSEERSAKEAVDSSSNSTALLSRMDSQSSSMSDKQPLAPPSSPQESASQSNTAEAKTESGVDQTAKTNSEMEGVSSELEELRACWQPRIVNWGSRLKGQSSIHKPFSGSIILQKKDFIMFGNIY